MLLSLSLQAQERRVFSDTTKKLYVPNHIVVQYAGGFGFLSAGLGFDFSSDKIALDILVGYLPKSIGGIDIWAIGAKSVYKPWQISIGKNMSIVPVNIGVFTIHAIGKQYSKIKHSNYYPKGYYWWPSNTRIGPTIGQNYYFSILKQKGEIKTLEIYWDFSADDFGIYSYFDNKTVKLKNIFFFDIGIKYYF